jgi:shikimate dehydrogenase
MIAFDEKGKATGYNLDGFGMIQDIKVNHKEDLAGKRILLIGAGGAASGVLGPLLQENPASLTMVNRTAKNAKKLAKRFKDLGDIKLSTYDDLGSDFDVLINATSTSAQGICPPMPDAVFDNHPFCYDLMYGKSQFLAWAKSMGVTRMADGAGMLLELSKQAFYIWRGVKP